MNEWPVHELWVHAIGLSFLVGPFVIALLFLRRARVAAGPDEVLVVFGPRRGGYGEFPDLPRPGTEAALRVRYYRGGRRSVLPLVDGHARFALRSFAVASDVSLVDAAGRVGTAVLKAELACGASRDQVKRLSEWVIDLGPADQARLLETMARGALVRTAREMPRAALLAGDPEFYDALRRELDARLEVLGCELRSVAVHFQN